jgi:hypothetical protein
MTLFDPSLAQTWDKGATGKPGSVLGSRKMMYKCGDLDPNFDRKRKP